MKRIFLQSQTDAVLGWVDKSTGRAFVMDTWISGYSNPLLDSSQDIFNASGYIKDGETTLRFSRKRSTKDNRDLSFTDEQCLYLMFPVKGGAFNPVNKKIRKHETVPIVSAEKVCIKSCGIDGMYFFFFSQRLILCFLIHWLENNTRKTKSLDILLICRKTLL